MRRAGPAEPPGPPPLPRDGKPGPSGAPAVLAAPRIPSTRGGHYAADVSAQPIDRRVRRSRTALEAALLELLAERELSQISVSDLTGRADVHRSTFYEHYTDVHDLAASACTQMFDQLITATAALPADDVPAHDGAAHHALSLMFEHVAAHRPLYRALLGADGSARVMNHLLEQMADGVRTGLSKRARRRTDGAPSPAAAAFIAGALMGTITDWLRRGCPETPEELSAAVWPLLLATPATHPPRT